LHRPGPGAGGGQPGGQRTGQRLDDAAHGAQLVAGRAQEFDALGQLRDAIHLDVVTAELLGSAPFGLGVDHLAKLCNPLRRERFGDLLLGRCGFVAVGGEQAGQQLTLQLVECHRLECLIRRVRRTATGVVFAVGIHDLGNHRDQSLVHVGELRVVGQQIEQHLAHRFDVVGRQLHLGIDGAFLSDRRPGAQCGRPPQVEHRVVGFAVLGPAKHRTRQTFAQDLAVAEPEDSHHPAGIDGFRRAYRDALPAKRFDEAHQMARQTMRGQRLAGANAADGHQRGLSSAAVRRWPDSGRTDA